MTGDKQGHKIWSEEMHNCIVGTKNAGFQKDKSITKSGFRWTHIKFFS